MSSKIERSYIREILDATDENTISFALRPYKIP